MSTINGTSADDLLNGTAGDDTLNGLEGNDTLIGGAGSDTLNGGTGDDTFVITGTDSASYDAVDGGAGFDVIVGGAGDDTFRLTSLIGVETIDGGAGVNVITGRPGYDFIIDLSGTLLLNIAQIVGDTGNDTITGSAGDDVIVGGAGNDTLNGGAGNDTFIITGNSASYDLVNGGSGADRILGGAGDDTFRFCNYSGPNTVETIDGGTGVNVIAARLGYDSIIDLSGTLLLNIAQIVGDTGNDTITGSAGDDVIVGGAGNDTLNGCAGNDTFIITGSSANYDLVSGGSGADRVLGGAGDDTFRFYNYSGANTVETIDGGAGVNVIAARPGNDSIIDLSGTLLLNIAQIVGDTGNDTITGSAGDDVIVGGAGNDTLNGGAGNDTFIITGSSASYDLVNGGSGADRILGGAGDDTFRFYNYSGPNTVETIDGGAGVNVIAARPGNDSIIDLSGTLLLNIAQIVGDTGNDTITGSAGNDVIVGGAGNDTLNGCAGNDTFIITGSSANYDLVSGGSGADRVLGGAGDDTFRFYNYSGANTVETIDGGAGVNVIAARPGNDSIIDLSGTLLLNIARIVGDTGNDTITGSAGDDVIVGGAGNDTLNGGAGNDILNGGTGNDILNGGLGDDTYIVDSVSDVVSDTSGIDTVSTTLSSYTLASALENLSYLGAGNFTGTGNGAANTIIGSTGADTLTGGAGNDMLRGGTGNDLYLFNTGFGQDIVADNDTAPGNVDIIRFGAGITPGTVAASRSGFDLLLTNGPDRITIQSWFASDADKVERVEFADSTVWNVTDLFNLTGAGGSPGNPPVNSVPGTQAINEDTALAFCTANGNAISVADIDSANLAVQLTVGSGTLTLGSTPGTLTIGGNGSGAVTLSGAVVDIDTALQGLTYAPAANANGSVTLTVRTGDGGTPTAGLTDSDNVTINIAPVNDAPVATNLSAAEAYTEDTPLNLTDIVASDIDSANVTARLTLSNLAAGSLSTATSGAVTSTFAAGVWTASGALADINTLLAGVTYNPAANFNSNFTIATSVSDGVAAAVTGTKNVTGTAVNDAPTVTNLGAAETYTEDAPLNLTDIVVSDVDSANITATLTLSTVEAGSLSTGTSGAVTSTFAAGVWTASGALANVNTLLADVTFNPAANFNANFSIATSVSDGVAPAITGAKPVTGVAVNDAPTATNLSAAEPYTEDTPRNLTDIVVSDVDSANVTATLTLSNAAAGSLSTATSGAVTSTFAGGVWSANGALADVNTLLAGVTFNPAANFNANFSIVTSVSDGVAPAVTGSKPMTGTAVNDAPTATNLNAADAYQLNTTANLADIATSDVDSANVTATLTLSDMAAGSLSTATSGAVTSTFGGGVWTASGAVANVNTLLAGVTFIPAAGFSSNFSIATSVSDGVAAPVTGSKAMTFTADTPPSATNLGAPETYTEDLPLNLTDIVVTDPDSTSVIATLTLSNAAAGGLSTATSGSVTSTFNPGTGIWTASGAIVDVNTLLAGVTFNPAANFNASFSIATSVSDGVAPAVTGTKAMTGTPVNDAPTATYLSTAETYTEDTPRNLTDIVVSDVDSANVTATLTLSNAAAGSLSTATSGAVTSTFAAGVWTASGAIVDVNTLLAGVTFNPAANFNASFSIATSVSDGVAPAVTGTKAMTGTPVNDAPTATYLSTAETYTEDTPRNLTDIVVSDVDSANVTATLTLSNAAAGSLSTATSGAVTSTFAAGVWTASGAIASVNALLAGVTFNPAANFNANFTIATSVSDGVAPAVTGTKAMTGTPVNDAPTATYLSAAEIYTEDTPRNLTDIVVSDVDSANVTATLTLSSVAAGSLSTATSGAVTSTFAAGVWTASGAIVDVNTLLAGVTFNPAANFNANFTIATSVSDGVAPAVTGTKAMTGTPVNDAPTATYLSAAEIYTEDTPRNLTDIVVSDVDSANVTATLTLSSVAAGSLSTATSGAVTSTFAGGVWSAAGAVTNVNALLASVAFNPAANFNSNFTIATSVSDGISSPVTGQKTMTGTAVNDAPTATNLSAAQSYTEDTPLNLADIAINDIDSASVTARLTLSNLAAGILTTGTSGAVTSTFAGGVWSAAGAVANVNALLASVAFDPAANFNSNFTIATSVSDGSAAPVTGTMALTGSGNLAGTTFNLTALNGANGGSIMAGHAANNRAGFSVSGGGDINGDGFDDYLVGAQGTALPGRNQAGVTYVVFGTAGGSANIADLDSLNGTTGFKIGGALSFERAGYSVSVAGDVNGDGFDDLLIGSWRGGYSVVNAYVVFGGPTFGATLDLASLNGSNGFAITNIPNDNETNSWARVGAAGDFNGDGFADIMVGNPRGDTGALTNNGQSWVIFGQASGFAASFSIATVGSTTAGFELDGGANNQRSGTFVSTVGDYNGDGLDDVAVGAPGNSQSYIYFGRTSGFSTVNLTNLTGANGGFRLTGSGGLGYSVASAGDVNGDGFSDWLVGAPNAGYGASYVVFGTASGVANFNVSTLNGANGFKINGPLNYGQGGYSASSAGDVNGDGFDDMIIGAPDSTFSGGVPGAGETYLVFGKATFGAAITLSPTMPVSDGIQLFATVIGDRAGNSVSAAGDINGDGFDDVVIGSPRSDPTTGTDAGRAYVVFGRDFRGEIASGDVGTSGDDVLSGTAGADILIGGRGNDTLTGGGGVDALAGGAGNDILIFDPLDRRADGGSGVDTLRFAAAGQTLDLTQVTSNKFQGIERIDLTGTGNNQLTLNVQDVLDMPDTKIPSLSGGLSSLPHVMIVNGNAGDSVTSTGQGWAAAAPITEGAISYSHYVLGTAHLLIETPLTQVIN